MPSVAKKPVAPAPSALLRARSSLRRLSHSGLSAHVFSLLGQIAGALPLLVISVYLARSEGLAAVGEFAALSGMSATTYMVAWAGFRALMVADRLETFSVRQFVFARTLLAALGTVFLVACGWAFQFAPMLVAATVFLRIGEGIVDLALGLQQVRSSATAIRSFGVNNAVRSGVVVMPTVAAMMGWVGGGSTLVAGFSALSMLVAVVLVLPAFSRAWELGRHASAQPYSKLLASAFWFGTAGAVCAAVTSLPRVLLPTFGLAEHQFGSAGAALSVATFFGMAFYGSWLRWAPRLRVGAVSAEQVRRFVLETGVILTLLLVGAWFVLSPVVVWMYRLPIGEGDWLVQQILLAAAVFFGAMNLANLFKATRAPWLETIAYLLPLGGGIAMASLLGGHVPALLLMLAALLTVGLAGGWIFLHRKARQERSA